MIDHTVPSEIAEAVKSEEIDVPARASILRIEPVCEAADFDRKVWIVVAFVVYRPDGSEWAGSAMLRTGGQVTPSYEVTADSLEGAKVVAQAFAVDGALKLGVRVTMGAPDDMPAKLDLPTKGR